MMSVQHSIMEGYLRSSPSKFMDAAGGWAENCDRILGLGQHGAGLGREIARLKGDAETAKKCGAVSDAFGAANSALGALRVIFPLERLVTGKMFWERNPDGTWLRARVENGEFVKRADGKYVTDNQYGVTPHRDFIDIIMDILSLVARTLSPINWLHGQGVYDLGKHSKAMSDTTMGIWGTVITLDIVQTVRAMKNDHDNNGYRERMKKRIADTVCNVLDLVALPFDFGYGMNSSPGLAIAGATLNIVSKGGYLVKEALYYS
jgi:hypothetical protein